MSNQWLDRIRDYVTEKREIRLQDLEERYCILWSLSDKIGKLDGSRDPGEIQALKYFIDNIIVLQNKGIIDEDKKIEKILLRKHPSERPEKYVDFIEAVNDRYKIDMDNYECLEDALVWADIAFGCETQALVAAMTCNIPSFSTIPPWAPKCRLPHATLNHLRDFC